MNKRILVAALAFASAGAFAQVGFGPDSVAILNLAGTGSTTGAASVLNYQFNRTTSAWELASTVTLSGGSTNFSIRSNSTTEGALQGSGPFGGAGYLYALGQNQPVGTAQATAEAGAKTIARINVTTGTVDYISGFGGGLLGSVRSASSPDGSTFYMTGGGGGVQTTSSPYTTVTRVGATTGVGSQTNLRVGDFFNGREYYSTASGSPTGAAGPIGVYSVDPASGTYQLELDLSGSSDPGDMHLSEDGLTMFVAEAAGARAGISQYTRASTATAFDLATRTAISTVATRQFGYGVWNNGANFELQENFFFTAADGTTATQLSRLAGTSDAFTSTLIATAGANNAFRGVDAVPEPATMAAMALGLGALAARRRRKSA